MAINYVPVPYKNFKRGVDQFSPESSIEEGFVESAVNAESVSGGLGKRKGYQGYFGHLPLRINAVTALWDKRRFSVADPQSVDMNSITSSPIVVYGKVPEVDGPSPGMPNPPGGYAYDLTTTNSAIYYPHFTVDSRISLLSTHYFQNYSEQEILDNFLEGPNYIPSRRDQHHHVVEGSTHGLTTPFIMTGLAESTDVNTTAYTTLTPEIVHVDGTSYDITISYLLNAPNSPQSVDAFVYYKDLSAIAGSVYHEAVTDQSTVTITAATHQLDNFNILVRCYDNSSWPGVEVTPDTVTISPTGAVTVTFLTNPNDAQYPETGFSGTIVLLACPVLNTRLYSAPPGTSIINIPMSGGEFPFVAAYYRDSSTGNLVRVVPDDISYSGSTANLTITYTVASTSAESVEIYYAHGFTVANSIVVTDTHWDPDLDNGETWVTRNPQLTVWGIGHEGIYLNEDLHGGHVTLIDSYKRSGESRLLAGLGGNLFSAQTRDEVGDTYLMPQFFTNGRSRADGLWKLAPLFQPTGSTVERTRGVITCGDVVDNRALVTAVVWGGGTEVVYTIATPSKVGTLVLGTQISGSDYLTVSGMGHSEYNGTFPVVSVADNATSISVRVTNTAAFSADYNDAGCAGRAGVFTDALTLDAVPIMIPGDAVASPSIPTALAVTVSSTDGAVITLGGITQAVEIPSGVRVFSGRTSDVIPLRADEVSSDSANLVKGDMLSVNGLSREVRVLHVNTRADLAVTINCDGTVATAVTPATHYLTTGQRVMLVDGSTPAITGVFTITVTASNTFTFPTTSTDTSLTATLVGHTAHIDEELTYSDAAGSATTFTVTGRWVPVEAPAATGNLLTQTRIHHFTTNEYDQQPIQRSTMVADSLFITNGDDEVMKFDGESIYRAGLIPWQPNVFVQVDTSNRSLRAGPTTAFTDADRATSSFTLATTAGYSVGDPVIDSRDNTRYTIRTLSTTQLFVNDPSGRLASRTQTFLAAACDIGTETITLDNHRYSTGEVVQISNPGTLPTPLIAATNYHVIRLTDSTFQLAASAALALAGTPINITDPGDGTNTLVSQNCTLVSPRTYKYYARLNAIDANNNITASAALGHEDLAVTLVADGQIKLRFVGLPAWGNLDYSSLELQLYRTKANDSVFWLVRNTKVTFNAADGYIDVADSTEDTFLTTPDATFTALLQRAGELGTAWEGPPRAKYITSAANSLLLANTKSYPYLDMTFLKTRDAASITDADMNEFRLLFRKDNTDAGTTTDNSTRVAYEFRSTGAVSITASATTRNSTSFTVTKVAHGLVVGNWVYLFHAEPGTDNLLDFAGWFRIASKTDDTFTITHNNTATAHENHVDRYVTAANANDVPVWLGTDGNDNSQSGNTTGSIEVIAAPRLAKAINATQRVGGFDPFMIAQSGTGFSLGQVRISQPRVMSTRMEVLVGTIPATFGLYINGVGRASADQVSTSTATFPSRVVVSYPNHPEIFDAPNDVDAQASDSIVDINPSDGQEITGILPFFGASAFGTAQVEGTVAVFKTGSVYLLDLEKRAYQKVQHPYGGCTAPYSLVHTRNGIMFANKAGIYRLNRDMTVTRVGKYLERLWHENVNKDALDKATAHNYSAGSQVKLSIPVGDGQLTNNQVFVYDHTKEPENPEGLGAWTIYDNHPATGWANLDENSFFGTTAGSVYKIRNVNDQTDYRDDAAAIPMVITLRSDDFGYPAGRKSLSGITTDLKIVGGGATTTSLEVATDLSTVFRAASTVKVTESNRKVISALSSVAERKAVRYQLRYTNSQKDQGVTVAGVTFQAALLGAKGTPEAADLS